MNLKIVIIPIVVLIMTMVATACAQQPMALKDVKTFMIQEQGLDSRKAIIRLAESKYDLLIIDVLCTLKSGVNVDMAAMVRQLRQGHPGRIVLAYFPIAEAESERIYWSGAWKAPGAGHHGTPDFLLAADPEGWSDTYVVAYWDNRWQDLLLSGKDSLLAKTMSAGFDGLMLDWANGYETEPIRQEAARQQIDPARAMVDLLVGIRDGCRRLNPNALIMAGDSVGLIDSDPRYLAAIDALFVQGTWYRGKAEASWDDSKGGDIPNRRLDVYSVANLVKMYARYQQAGKVVFTVDYCLKQGNADRVYRDARALGLVPLVSQVSLANMTQTPPELLKK